MIYLLRLFTYLKNYKRQVVLSLAFLAVSVTFNMVQPKLIEWVIDEGIIKGFLKYVLCILY